MDTDPKADAAEVGGHDHNPVAVDRKAAREKKSSNTAWNAHRAADFAGPGQAWVGNKRAVFAEDHQKKTSHPMGQTNKAGDHHESRPARRDSAGAASYAAQKGDLK